MHLTPREQERLLLAGGADLARRRLSRGAPLGASEAIALVCDEVLEMAWDAIPLDEIVERARQLIRAEQLLPDVAALVPVLQIEALFPHGTVLVHLAAPFGAPPPGSAGSVRAAGADLELAPGRERGVVLLHNTGTLPIWVSSHVPLDSLNRALRVDLSDAGKFRLDVPAGVAVKVGAGESREVAVVEIQGGRS
ncbi:MAG TPA: urease subunit gamma [Propionibacteriaceae bacterium]|nr:urease subunit gamma [Propionibacteriaceae bacterium]